MKPVDYKQKLNSPGMWILFCISLAICVTLTIIVLNTFLLKMSGDIMPTKVFTVNKDVVSLKLPDDWIFKTSDTGKSLTWVSANNYESLSISQTDANTVKEASIIYLLELKDMFQDVSMENFEYQETKINGKTMFAMNIVYQSQYYLCGVMESGNTIIKFVYSASIMTGEISDIDTIIGSINYRKGGISRE